MSPPRRKIARRPVHGVLLLDKPLGLSSNHALQAAKRLLRAEKAGHTGTLDPLATGLLPLCFGEATKFSQTLLDADKSYEAVVQLGSRTDTCDAEGQVIEHRAVDVTPEQLAQALRHFTGEIEQIPPMHSALKHHGTPLYELARRGETIERKARRVTIAHITLLDFDGQRARIHVDCSKGTYIRTLADDIGLFLGCGAHLAGLRRTRIAALKLDNAVTLDQLEAADETTRDSLLAPADSLLAPLPKLELCAEEAQRILTGQRILNREALAGECRLYAQGVFLGLARAIDSELAPSRLIARQFLAL